MDESRTGSQRPVIGFLLDWLEDPYQQMVFEGADRAARERDVSLICFVGGNTLYDPRNESSRDSFLSMMNRQNIDGLLLLSGALMRHLDVPRFTELLRRFETIPLLSISHDLPGIPSLVSDNRHGIRAMFRHLVVDHGLDSIAFIGGPPGNQAADERYEAFREASIEAGLPFDPETAYSRGDFTLEAGRLGALCLVQAMPVRPRAIMAANDDMAIGAVQALTRAGFRVPEDIAVVGFDDTEASRYSSPTIATISQELGEQGRRGFHLLCDAVEGKEVPFRTVLPTRMLVRESCGCRSEHDAAFGRDGLLGNAAVGSPTQRRPERLEGEHQVLEAFLSDLSDGGRSFPGRWRAFAEDSLKGDPSGVACRDSLFRLEEEARGAFSQDREERARAEASLNAARAAFAEALAYSERLSSNRIQEEQRALNYLRDDLVGVSEPRLIAPALHRVMTRAGFGRIHVSVLPENQDGSCETTAAAVLCSYDPVQGELSPPGTQFEIRRMTPQDLKTDPARRTWILEMLSYDECFGFTLLELATRNYRVYGEVGRIISSAMQTARLFRNASDQNERLKTQSEKLTANVTYLHKLMGGVVNTLALTLEMRDPYTAGHERRVADLSRSIANELGLSSDQIEAIRIASSLHDIGKLSVPAEILNKPGRLRDAEMSLIKLHPQLAFEILSMIEFPWPIAEFVFQHHERVDGTGYPRGLVGDKISIEAKIICVADVVEAMASHRPYRAALGIEVALQEIENKRGIYYDTEVASACLRLFREKGYAFKQTLM